MLSLDDTPRALSRIMHAVLAVVLLIGCGMSALAAQITNDVFWKDTTNNPIFSQGGGVFKFGGIYYWYGVKYNGAVTYYNNPTGQNSDSSFAAVTCYSSTDLVNWKFENNILTSSTPGLTNTTWFGRVGVVFNANTGNYVLLAQANFADGTTGEVFCTGTSPTGNFTFNNLQYPLPGVVNNKTGDQTVFTDDDGQSYLICSSASGRSNWYVIRIRPSDSLALETAVRIGGGVGREGNCMFKYNGRYYFCSSDLHGWNASHCYVLSSTSIQGTYSAESIMTNSEKDFCHVSQTGFFITVTGTSGTTVIFCGDRWSDFAGNGLGYNQWCPVTFNGTTPIFNSVSKWDLNAAAGTWSIAPGNNYVLNPSFEADRVIQTTLAGWSGTGTNGNTGGDRTGDFYLEVSAGTMSQIVKDADGSSPLPNGTYTLSAWVKSGGGQTAQVFARNFGGSQVSASITGAISSWTQVTIPNINVTNGQCEVGLTSTGGWVRVDDFQLVNVAPPLPPSAPTGLAAATVSSSQINLSWTASSGATSYNVKRAGVSGGPYTTIATGVSATSYSDGGLSASTTYYYVVSAVNTGGESVNSAQASATTQAPSVPPAPAGVSATPGNNQVALSWTASSGATSYNVKRATVSGGPYTTIASPTAVSYVDTTATNGTTYYYVISAVNSIGESANSTQVSAIPVNGISVTATLPGTSRPNQPGPTLATSTTFNMNGGNAVLLIVTSERGASTDVTSATFAGQPMTLGVSRSQGTQWAGIFYLINPATTSGQFVITSNTTVSTGDYAYSAIALNSVGSVASTAGVANTATGGTISLAYTTNTNGGFVVGAAANNAWDAANPPPSFISGKAGQTLLAPTQIDTSGHLHSYGVVGAAGAYTDVYGNPVQRNAYVTIALNSQ